MGRVDEPRNRGDCARMGASLVEVKGVTYTLNGRRILDDIWWTVREGENWAILGPNGAGKTTLLKLVCGYLWPNGGGQILRQGKSHADLGVLRRSIGWVTSTLVTDIPRGEKALNTVLSGMYAQIGLWSLPYEQPKADDVEAAARCLDQLDCDGIAERPFGTLSQGEQQKVLVCRALMAEPLLLILDEPCAGMDPGARETFLSALSAIGQMGGLPVLIYTTHHPEEILPAFERTLALKEGKIIAKGATDHILTSELLYGLYGISLNLAKKKGRYWPMPQ